VSEFDAGMEKLREVLYAATRRVIAEDLYAAMPPPDDIYDVTLHLDADGELLLARLHETIVASPDVQRALQFSGDREISREIAQGVLQRWVSEYRDLTGNLRAFDEARADELFADLKEMQRRATIPARMTTPVFSFEMDAQELHLRPDLSVASRHANPLIRRNIDLAWGSLLMGGGFPRAVPMFAITSTFESPPERLEADREMDRHERVTSALRLLKACGSPHIGTHLVSVERPALRLPNTIARDIAVARGVPHFSPFADTYVLRRTDEPGLARLVEQLDDHAGDEALTFALRRFADSHARTRDEDKIVDYWVALESMFSKETTEVTYRVSMRAARFIGVTAEERSKLRGSLKRS
jgi:hypothetical protein